MKQEYEKTITDFLIRRKFAVGKDLTAMIQKYFPISPENARKIIGRMVQQRKLASSSPVTFGNRQFAYFLPGHYLNMEMILAITKEHRPPLYRILSVIQLQEGIISFYEVLKLAALVLDNSRTKKNVLEKVISELFELQLIKTTQDSYGSKYIILSSKEYKADSLMAMQRGKMTTDAMFIPDILKTLQRSNLIDNIKVLYRGTNTPLIGVQHNNHVWDAVAYTRTTGINIGRASQADGIEKQTLVVLDVVIHRDYTEFDYQGFYDRIQSVIHSVKKGTRKVMPVIIYARMSNTKLLNTIHKVGFLTFSIGAIYGERIFDVISNLNTLRLKEMLGERRDMEGIIENTLSIVKGSGQEDNLSNIRGDLFEFLLYPLLLQLFPVSIIEHSVKLNAIDPDKGKYEFDYVVKVANKRETVVIELKGYSSTSKIALGDTGTKNTVAWFFGTTLPSAQQELSKEIGNPRVTGCYITSASFTEDAVSYLQNLNNSKIKPSYLDTWYDKEKLVTLLEERGLQHVKKILQHYFTGIPLPDPPYEDNSSNILESLDLPS
jgi:predicted site-specific integrase-resolvase